MGAGRRSAGVILRPFPRGASPTPSPTPLSFFTWSRRRWARSSISTSKSTSRRDLERDRHWLALGLFDLKEDFVAIGLGLLPAYWV